MQAPMVYGSWIKQLCCSDTNSVNVKICIALLRDKCPILHEGLSTLMFHGSYDPQKISGIELRDLKLEIGLLSKTQKDLASTLCMILNMLTADKIDHTRRRIEQTHGIIAKLKQRADAKAQQNERSLSEILSSSASQTSFNVSTEMSTPPRRIEGTPDEMCSSHSRRHVSATIKKRIQFES